MRRRVGGARGATEGGGEGGSGQSRRMEAEWRGRVRSARRTPHGEADVLVLDSLDVEADRGDGGDNLAKLELVQDGGLASRVKPDHQDAHILLAEQLAEDLGEGETHAVRWLYESTDATKADVSTPLRAGGTLIKQKRTHRH